MPFPAVLATDSDRGQALRRRALKVVHTKTPAAPSSAGAHACSATASPLTARQGLVPALVLPVSRAYVPPAKRTYRVRGSVGGRHGRGRGVRAGAPPWAGPSRRPLVDALAHRRDRHRVRRSLADVLTAAADRQPQRRRRWCTTLCLHGRTNLMSSADDGRTRPGWVPRQKRDARGCAAGVLRTPPGRTRRDGAGRRACFWGPGGIPCDHEGQELAVLRSAPSHLADVDGWVAADQPV